MVLCCYLFDPLLLAAVPAVAQVEIEHLLGQLQAVMDQIDNNKEPSQIIK